MFLYRTPNRRSKQAFTLVEVLVSFVLFSLVISGFTYGYVQVNQMATWASWSLAAQSIAAQGMERARGAQWNELGDCDEWPPTTNAAGHVAPYIDTNCTLDVPSTGKPIYVKNYITITAISASPPLRQIRSDCVWNFPVTGQLCTNTVITWRAPDQ